MPSDFNFDDGTTFDAHKGSEPSPDAPLPTPADVPQAVARRRGRVRTGKYPMRKPPSEAKRQRGHAWALSDAWKPIYVEALARYGTLTDAADAAQVSMQTAAARRKMDPEFDAACQDAQQRYNDGLEREIAHRAIVGRTRKVVTKSGEIVEVGPEPSDLMLIFHAKKRIPDYRDNHKPTEAPATQILSQVLVNFIKGFNPNSDDQSVEMPFDKFMTMPQAIAPPGPFETPDQEKARLLARLAELESTETEATPDADDRADQVH